MNNINFDKLLDSYDKQDLFKKIELKEVGTQIEGTSKIIFLEDKVNKYIYCFEEFEDWKGGYFEALEVIDDKTEYEKNPCIILPYNLRNRYNYPAFGNKKEISMAEIEKIDKNCVTISTDIVGFIYGNEEMIYQEDV